MLAAPPERSDEVLARQSQAGVLSSFEELVFRYENRIYGFLVKCCRHEADAEELTQTTFVTAYRAIQQYRPDHSFAAWLFTIARRKFIDHHRAARPEAQEEPSPEAWDTNDPSVILARREEERDLWAEARRLLPRDQFDAFWLQHHEEMSVKDIAQALRRTQTSVKVLLFRARRTLVQRLNRHGPASVPANHRAAGATTAKAPAFPPGLKPQFINNRLP